MPKKTKIKKKKEKSFEEKLWQSANSLRGNVESAEYKHIVLALIFLKFISDKFEVHRNKLSDLGQNKYLEMSAAYAKDNVFYLPECSRWEYIKINAKKDGLSIKIDTALKEIEAKNTSLKGALPENYFSRLELESSKLASLVDIISSIDTVTNIDEDIIGRVYEYFLAKFAIDEGKGKGEFYTPKNVVNLLVNFLKPFEGKVYDPCCGSGGMFVQSLEFVKKHGGNTKKISIYGQEGIATTLKLAKMNLAIRSITSNLGLKARDTFHSDLHKELKADFILANPPFNQSNWRQEEQLVNDSRWQDFVVPPVSNANYGWILHMLSKLSEKGVAGFVMGNMSIATQDQQELKIRKELIQKDFISSIIALPDKLFYTTPIPVCIWIIEKNKPRHLRGKTLFIDAENLAVSIDRNYNDLNYESIKALSELYSKWRSGENLESNNIEFQVATNDQIIANDYSLHPPAYTFKIDKIEPKDSLLNCFNDFERSLKKIYQTTKNFEDSYEKITKKVETELIPAINKGIPYRKYQLHEILEPSSELLGDKEEPEILTCTETAGLVLQKDRFAKRVATENTKKYKVVRRGDIVYNPYLLWAKSIDQCNVVDIGITSPAYEVFRIKNEYDKNLIGFILTHPAMIKAYKGISIGTVTRRRRAAPERFLKLEIQLPNLNFQNKYSNLLEELIEIKNKSKCIEIDSKKCFESLSEILLS